MRFDFIRGSLLVKMIASFLVVALIPLGIVGYLSFSSSKDALQKNVFDNLSASRDRGKANVLEYLQQTVSDSRYLGKTPAVERAFKTLQGFTEYALYLEYAKANPKAPVDVNSEEFKQILTDTDPIFKRFLENYELERGYQDILVVVGDDLGVITYTAKRLPDFGATLKSESMKNTPLAHLWEKVRSTHKPAISDFSYYVPAKAVSAFAAAPVFHSAKQLYGVLFLRFGPEIINGVMAENSKTGKTGDSFIVGQDLVLRSDSRADEVLILKTKIDTKATEEAIQGKSGIGEIKGMRGIPVLNAWGPVGLMEQPELGADFNWGLVTKVDSWEAFAPVTSLGYRTVLIAVAIGLIVAILAFFLARTIAGPIMTVAEQATRISGGDLTVTVTRSNRRDELGKLANAFGQMVGDLRIQIKQIYDGVNVLAASTAQISSTVSEVVAATSRVSEGVSETSATVEEVRQASKLSSDKAKRVADSSREAVQVSEAGQKAAHNTIEGIKVIRRQMESIGETVVKLSEQSQAIEDIIDAVQDIADQSNLLAVNASIEAARAGDQGKGFAVVASEIKSLADQSKQATEQVRGILDDTRKWVSAVVMATEQGGKAVEAGVSQSLTAGEAIQTLAESVSTASQAATVIDASAQQGFTGLDQVSGAMVNVERATRQNLEAMKQLEDATRKLTDLGSGLKDMVDSYKI
jgi:methyl-accepting chemotaxis protein